MARNGEGDLGPRSPRSSLILGYGSVLPILLAAILVPAVRDGWPQALCWIAIWWAASILTFLAGVRRGLSFQGDQSPQTRDLIIMLWLYALGAGAIATALGTGRPLLPLTMLILGFATVSIVDPIAARIGAAPRHFEKLRPRQMGIALLGLIALLVERIAMAVPI